MKRISNILTLSFVALWCFATNLSCFNESFFSFPKATSSSQTLQKSQKSVKILSFEKSQGLSQKFLQNRRAPIRSLNLSVKKSPNLLLGLLLCLLGLVSCFFYKHVKDVSLGLIYHY